MATLALSACFPELEDTPWLVEGARVLAVGAEPAEVAPGAEVRLSALWTGAPGDEAAFEWSLCTSPRPLTERNAVAARCLEAGPHLVSIDPGRAIIPLDACARFGPIAPPPQPGESPRRPADPDPTGGFYQPVRVAHAGRVDFGLVRLRCPLAGAPEAIVRELSARYRANEAPTLAALDELGPISAGVEVELSARYSAPEVYAYYDAEARAVVDREEVLRVSWFVDGGALVHGEAGVFRAPGESSNAFVAEGPREVRRWVVLRDSRGGVSWRAAGLTVR